MKKKYLGIFLLILLAIMIYLYLAHAHIYRRISQAHLKATDNMHTYVLGDEANGSKNLIYSALGDSLTSGAGADKYEESYPYLLAKSLAENDKVVVHKNFSYPGARTDDLIRDLLAPALASQPDLVTLLIGTNDVHGFVDTDDFEKNYEYIVRELKTKTRAKVYLISIPRIGSNTLILPPYDRYFDSKISEYNEFIKILAKNYELEYIDLDSPTADILKKDGSHYSVDSFHPSASGYALWAKILYDNIDK